VQGVGGAVRGREVVCSAGAGGEGVEAALEEFVVGAGEGEVLWVGVLVLCCVEIIVVTGRLTAPRMPKPSSMSPQMAAQQ
jgi:hypothetical protein